MAESYCLRLPDSIISFFIRQKVSFQKRFSSSDHLNVINTNIYICFDNILAKTRRKNGHHKAVRGMFEMNCLLSSSLISTWGTIKTNTCLYRAIQYLHNGV